MNKLYTSIIAIIILFVSIFAFVIYNYNKSLSEEQLAHQQEIAEMKDEQEKLTEEFEEGQQEKVEALGQEYTTTMQRDQDGDGLTYEQELALGTSDDDVDSDGDRIWDNKDRHPAGGGITYTKTVYWIHKGLQYTTQFGIHEDKYWFYKDQKRGYCCKGWDKFATPDDPTIQTIAQDVVDVSISTGDTCKSCIAIDFVESMIYEYDIDYIGDYEYPKYAIETIIDEKGDCEDTSFLMASILEAIGIDTILLVYSDHMAVGVWCDGCTGSYYDYKGRKYFFLETTGYADNWEIGRIWGKYAEESPLIIEV